MVQVDPSKYDVLLVGPRVARLEPFFSQQGYRTTPAATGASGVATLERRKFHLVVMELELDDYESHDFLSDATRLQPDAAIMLLDDPARTGMIVSSFVQGVDVYVPTPPDERRLFEQVARHVLAAAARGGGTGDEVAQAEAEAARARASLEEAGAKVRKLTSDVQRLEDEVQRLKDDLENEKMSGRAAREERASLQAEVDRLKSTATVAAGGSVMSKEEIEEIQARSDFVEFLESENEELKRERDRLRAKLRSLGGASGEAPALSEDDTGEGEAVPSLDDGPAEVPAYELAAAADEEGIFDDDSSVFDVVEPGEGPEAASGGVEEEFLLDEAGFGEDEEGALDEELEDQATQARPAPTAPPPPAPPAPIATAPVPAASAPVDDVDEWAMDVRTEAIDVGAVLADVSDDSSEMAPAPSAESDLGGDGEVDADALIAQVEAEMAAEEALLSGHEEEGEDASPEGGAFGDELDDGIRTVAFDARDLVARAKAEIAAEAAARSAAPAAGGPAPDAPDFDDGDVRTVSVQASSMVAEAQAAIAAERAAAAAAAAAEPGSMEAAWGNAVASAEEAPEPTLFKHLPPAPGLTGILSVDIGAVAAEIEDLSELDAIAAVFDDGEEGTEAAGAALPQVRLPAAPPDEAGFGGSDEGAAADDEATRATDLSPAGSSAIPSLAGLLPSEAGFEESTLGAAGAAEEEHDSTRVLDEDSVKILRSAMAPDPAPLYDDELDGATRVGVDLADLEGAPGPGPAVFDDGETRVASQAPPPPARPPSSVPSNFNVDDEASFESESTPADGSEAPRSLSADELFGGDENEPTAYRPPPPAATPPSASAARSALASDDDDFDGPTISLPIQKKPAPRPVPKTELIEGIGGLLPTDASATQAPDEVSIEIDDDF